MELVDIVDKNGNFTGETMDKEEAHDKNLLHNEVVAFIVNDNGQVLLQLRSPNKRFNANKWALCAGHVDAGESLEHAMIREIEEEIGLKISEKDLHTFIDRKIEIKEKNSHVSYYFYLKTNLPEKAFTIQEEELSKVKWFDIDEIIKRIQAGDESLVLKKDKIEPLKRLMQLVNDRDEEEL